MGSEIFVLVGVFALSCSLIFNFVLVLVVLGVGLFLKNVLDENREVQAEIVELDSQLIVADSVNSIIEHVLALRDNLEEVLALEMYTGEPILHGLMGNIQQTLEKIETSVINQEYLKSIENKK